MGFATALAAFSLASGLQSRADAKDDANKARQEGEAAQRETQVRNAQAAAAERRQQVREERIKRARVIQASENTGTSGSSGEAGAISNLSTQLSENLGANQFSLRSAARQSINLQNQANYNSSAQLSMNNAQTADTLFNLSANRGGLDILFK